VRITKFTHACVRLEQDGRVLVIDPGVWTEPEALDGAHAVLVTHEHFDHIDVQKVVHLPVFAPEGADIQHGKELHLTRVKSGQRFEAAGFDVQAVGDRHAIAYGKVPDCPNLGFVVDETVYHPGDALHVPDRPIETLFAPAQAPWLKLAEALDFVKAVRPKRTFQLHDGMVNERGLGGLKGWFERAVKGFRYLEPGETA
jgi:L-ascorbate metabolism protein UlaG (beta-lactamase superfamily)